ncbi:MAG: hypothetical protein ACR2PX_03755 [Endozoicomonas sp.]|uniref:hypothetical protein n=1 Tax=Endozoicomonas sp. TaxID=1892382 RepID=UPI003D9AD7EC
MSIFKNYLSVFIFSLFFSSATQAEWKVDVGSDSVTAGNSKPGSGIMITTSVDAGVELVVVGQMPSVHLAYELVTLTVDGQSHQMYMKASKLPNGFVILRDDIDVNNKPEDGFLLGALMTGNHVTFSAGDYQFTHSLSGSKKAVLEALKISMSRF